MTVQIAKCPKINHFFHLNMYIAALSATMWMPCHAKAYIRVFRYNVPQNEKSFARENLSENKFLTALILYESKNSGGSIILFLMTLLLKPAKLS